MFCFVDLSLPFSSTTALVFPMPVLLLALYGTVGGVPATVIHCL